MQEMIDKLHARCDFCLEKELISEWGTLRMTIIEAQSLLEKEKEQIMDSYLQGSFDDGPNITNSEQYYNQTYNQNK